MSDRDDTGRARADRKRMECSICWHLYDPAEGDEEWQIPPGTPFTSLPEGWSCPKCDAAPERFLHVED